MSGVVDPPVVAPPADGPPVAAPPVDVPPMVDPPAPVGGLLAAPPERNGSASGLAVVEEESEAEPLAELAEALGWVASPGRTAGAVGAPAAVDLAEASLEPDPVVLV